MQHNMIKKNLSSQQRQYNIKSIKLKDSRVRSEYTNSFSISVLVCVCVENHKMGFLRAPGCTNLDYTANLACNLRAALLRFATGR